MYFNFVPFLLCYCRFRDARHIIIRELVKQIVPDNNCEKARSSQMQINLDAYVLL